MQAAGAQRPEELAPERLGLGLADVEADHLAAAGLVHGVGDHQALLAHPAALADLLDLAVQPQVGVAALQWPLAEDLHLLIEAATEPGDLVLGQMQPHLLDEAVDLARGDAVDVGLLDDRDQRLLGTPARMQEAREVAALAQLRDLKLDLPGARVPRPRPIAVALRHALAGDLTELGADLPGDLGLHQLGDHPRDALAHDIGVLAAHQLVDHLRSGHPPLLGHRGASPSSVLSGTDDSEARGGRPSFRTSSARPLHHFYRLDPEGLRRRLICDEPPGSRAAVQKQARILVAEASLKQRAWWRFERATEVDCVLATDRLVLCVEGKRNERLSRRTEWLAHRHQLAATWRRPSASQAQRERAPSSSAFRRPETRSPIRQMSRARST